MRILFSVVISLIATLIAAYGLNWLFFLWSNKQDTGEFGFFNVGIGAVGFLIFILLFVSITTPFLAVLIYKRFFKD